MPGSRLFYSAGDPTERAPATFARTMIGLSESNVKRVSGVIRFTTSRAFRSAAPIPAPPSAQAPAPAPGRLQTPRTPLLSPHGSMSGTRRDTGADTDAGIVVSCFACH